MKKIELVFDKADTSLAGFPYGKKVYENQVKNEMDFSESLTIVFPEQIERVASSFIQGFFSDIINIIGYGGIERQIEIDAKTKELSDSIKRNIR